MKITLEIHTHVQCTCTYIVNFARSTMYNTVHIHVHILSHVLMKITLEIRTHVQYSTRTLIDNTHVRTCTYILSILLDVIQTKVDCLDYMKSLEQIHVGFVDSN